jgi:hypothetical protein
MGSGDGGPDENTPGAPPSSLTSAVGAKNVRTRTHSHLSVIQGSRIRSGRREYAVGAENTPWADASERPLPSLTSLLRHQRIVNASAISTLSGETKGENNLYESGTLL